MNYEKSCGAVVIYRKNKLKYLLIFNKKGNASGHWGFPKGHMEEGETELSTAKREIFEETGLSPEFIDSFRVVSHYCPRPGVEKDSVYFLAEATDDNVTIQASELADYRWCTFDKALDIITYDHEILKQAHDFLMKK